MTKLDEAIRIVTLAWNDHCSQAAQAYEASVAEDDANRSPLWRPVFHEWFMKQATRQGS